MDRISKANYYLDIAQTVLERATCLRRVYGAIIVKNDEIISTGYVSNFVQVDYTTGMAHAMYNGFTILTHSGLPTYIEQDEFPELNAAYKKTAWWKATHVQK